MLPAKSVGVYWPYWSAPAVANLPRTCNTLYLFSARPNGGTPGSNGSVYWDQGNQSGTSFKSDLLAFRAGGGAVIISIGGAGEYIRLDTRSRSQAFVASIQTIYNNLGGLDGLDWDIESTELYPNEMVWIAQQLKAMYPGFSITFAAAPWRTSDVSTAKILVANNALDMVSPQYYDLSGLNTETDKINHMTSNIQSVWIPAMGGDARKVGIGCAQTGASEVMAIGSCVTAWKTLVSKYPSLRGAFVWEAQGDYNSRWSFLNTMGPVVNPPLTSPSTSPTITPTTTTPTTITPTPSPSSPTNTYTVVSGDTLRKIATKLGVSWTSLARLNNLQSPYALEIGDVLKIPTR